VADSFEVMTAGRPYQAATDFRTARAEMARCARSQFDPVVVRALLAVSLPRMRGAMGVLSGLSPLPVLLHHLPRLALGGRVGQTAAAAALSAGVAFSGVAIPTTLPAPSAAQASITALADAPNDGADGEDGAELAVSAPGGVALDLSQRATTTTTTTAPSSTTTNAPPRRHDPLHLLHLSVRQRRLCALSEVSGSGRARGRGRGSLRSARRRCGRGKVEDHGHGRLCRRARRWHGASGQPDQGNMPGHWRSKDSNAVAGIASWKLSAGSTTKYP
jgi:hypothetical protein